jgi:predicted nucleic acid-binding protein
MIFDTSAWIELFQGTKAGQTASEALAKGGCYTSMISLAEIVSWCIKTDHDPSKAMARIAELSTIIDVSIGISSLAGRLNLERKKVNKKWGMMDSFVLATAVIYGLTVLTKDEDYMDLPNAVML